MSAASTSEPLSIRRAEPGAQVPWNYSQTPSGTIYSSTPGGSRIIYNRSTLLALASSPLAKSPPGNLDYIKNVISSSHEGSQQHLTPQTAVQHNHHQGHNGHVDITHNHEKHGKGQHQANPWPQSLDKNKEETKVETNKSNINPYALLSKEDDVFEMDME